MLTWIEQRTGFVSMAKEFLTEDIPGGASYWYVFGSATLFAMILQIATGIFITFFYAPSANTAWESTDAMYHNGFQHFVLSVHSWGASAMIALVFLHMLQVIIWGAYKSPRELQWIVGVLLFIVTLVLGLTGYLLPWDMNAYFASQVAINISGTAPVLGPAVQEFLQGGAVMGTLTINRFFGIHVWLMPIALLGLVGAHLAIFRYNGPAGPVTDDRRGLKIGKFFPDQVFMDTVVSFAVFFIIVMLSLFAPPGLDAKADPTNASFVPYPAWYFLSLFGLLAIMPPSLELVGTIIIPTLAIIGLMLLPWLDRSTVRSFGSRAPILWITTISIIGVVALSIWSQMGILQKQAAAAAGGGGTPAAAAPAAPASSGNTASAPSGGAAAPGAGSKVYANNCSTCHGAAGAGVPGAFPPLAGNAYVTGDKAKVIGVLLNGLHGSISVNGQTYNGQMPAWKGSLSNKDIADVVTFIRASWGNTAAAVTEADVTKLAK
ncbi:MAG: cytochrome b N-terminal domain-containing protein [Candidatus Eremiobacteraeota bacterium]|nr:cytochrome b N-terminal domain-containing protein [Candidatus Eremiobacteraeota bacterium]